MDHAIDHWLERLAIPEYKFKTAGELSKGNQQKIQLIAALLHNPELLILDNSPHQAMSVKTGKG